MPVVAERFIERDRTPSNVSWWLRNLTKLVAVLAVGFVLAAATHPDALPDDPLPAVARMLGNAAFSLVLLGMLMVPMGLVHLAALAIVGRSWSPFAQRTAALVLSPLVTSPVWFTGTTNIAETLLFAVAMPATYGLIVTLPRGAQHGHRAEQAQSIDGA